MKNSHIVLSMLVAAFLVCQGTAFAMLVSGKVTKVDSAANTVSVNSTNAEGASEELTFSASPETQYTGVAALVELTEGTEVWVDAEEDAATGSWKATSIKVGGPEAAVPVV